MAKKNPYDMFKIYDWNSLFGTTWSLQQNQMSALSQLTSPLSVWKTPNIIDNLSPALLKLSDAARQIIPKTYYEPSQIERIWRSTFIGFDSLKASLPDTSALFSSPQSIAAAIQPRYSILDEISNSFRQYHNLSNGLFSYWKEKKFDDISDADIESLSEEDKNEVSKAVNEIIAEPENWQQKFTNKLTAIKSKNPVIAAAIIIIIGFLLQYFMENAFDNIFSTTKPVKVREEPTSSSITINIVQPQQTVYVIGEATYYYEVEYINIETGKGQRGYVSKRSAHESFFQVQNTDAVDENKD